MNSFKDLYVTLNNKKINLNLERNRSKRLERYIYNYAVDHDGWQLSENIIENLFDAKNVNVHDPKFPFVDLIIKDKLIFPTGVCRINELLNIKSSKKRTLKSAIYSSIRDKNPSKKFLISQVNYILRATESTKAGDTMLGSKYVNIAMNSKNFKIALKKLILEKYNQTHLKKVKKFNQLQILDNYISICYIYNPTKILDEFNHKTICTINLDKTKSIKLREIFNRTLNYWNKKKITDLIFYTFKQSKYGFDYSIKLSTILNQNDIQQIQNIYGLHGEMSNIKNELINRIRDLGNMNQLKELEMWTKLFLSN